MRVVADDVIIFYHSGHGHSSNSGKNDKSESVFPSMACAKNPPGSLKLEDISTQLRNKKARLTITIADSCNKRLEIEAQASRIRIAPSQERINAMFRDFSGYVLMSSSLPGESSFYGEGNYGKFTEQFLYAVQTPSENVPITGLWTNVLESSRQVITATGRDWSKTLQHPQYRQELRYLKKK